MKLSPAILVGALTSCLCLAAGPAQAAADISAQDCVRGGGVIIINAVGDGAFTKYCEGGTHDGETIT
ncbi:hypothetical protein ACFV29_40580 [Streptomyces sp. NPDC059690]|uniref:hypothetical protein n=1 Tax=Streptomyces sp. NPDC059690 TaxID=3346907 RepID=UPI0036C81407